MSGLELEPLDGAGRVELPGGQTVIGRGPLLGVSDKRVSRNHGLLEVIDGKLRIKPTHTNPCFHQSSNTAHLLPLEKDKWHCLNPGDCFALLPDKYIYKVISTNFEQTLRNSQLSSFEDLIDVQSDSPKNLQTAKEEGNEDQNTFQDSTESPTRISSRTLTKEDPSSSRERNRTESHSNSHNLVKTLQSKREMLKNDCEPLDLAQRKRVLPAWMLQVSTDVQSSSSAASKSGGRSGRGDANQIKPHGNQTGRKRQESFESDEETGATDPPPEKKGRLKTTEQNEGEIPTEMKNSATEANYASGKNKEEINDEPETPAKTTEKNTWRLCKDEGQTQQGPDSTQSLDMNEWEISDIEEEEPGLTSRQSEQESPQQSATSRGQRLGKVDRGKSPEHVEHRTVKGATAPQSIEQKQSKKTPCMYGNNCYRKNPVHFQNFSHPGDADYEDSVDGDDDRPECPFGTACYRKNPEHKKDYKHTKPPESEQRRPKRKGKSVLTGENDDDGNSNEYSLNDSFIDDEDDLEPTDEDSEWEPSSGSEDIDTLVKEANTFIKKKK
uniref:Aprataxin and PNK-like factor-like protein n=1 Tax=Callorhinchus milii TaxID=7868 RepID=V9KJS4_CALMI